MALNPRTRYPIVRSLNRYIDDALTFAASEWLWDEGWSVASSSDVAPATATTNPYTNQIVVKPGLAAKPSRRHRLYVLPHEAGHALDFLAGRPSAALAGMIGLNAASAQEALGEAVALWGAHYTSEGRAWVRASITWHSLSPRWEYRWSHVRHPATKELATILVHGPGRSVPGVYFRWEGGRVVPV